MNLTLVTMLWNNRIVNQPNPPVGIRSIILTLIFLTAINAYFGLIFFRGMAFDGARFAYTMTHFYKCQLDNGQLRLLGCLFQLPGIAYMKWTPDPHPLMASQIYFGGLYIFLIGSISYLFARLKSADDLLLALTCWVVAIYPVTPFLINAVNETAVLSLFLYFAFLRNQSRPAVSTKIIMVCLTALLCFGHQYVWGFFLFLVAASLIERKSWFNLFISLIGLAFISWRLFYAVKIDSTLTQYAALATTQKIQSLLHGKATWLDPSLALLAAFAVLPFMRKKPWFWIWLSICFSIFVSSFYRMENRIDYYLKWDSFALKNFTFPIIIIFMGAHWLRQKIGFLPKPYIFRTLFILAVAVQFLYLSIDHSLSVRYMNGYKNIQVAINLEKGEGCFTHEIPTMIDSHLLEIGFPVVAMFMKNQRNVRSMHFALSPFNHRLRPGLYDPCNNLKKIPFAYAPELPEKYWFEATADGSNPTFFNFYFPTQ